MRDGPRTWIEDVLGDARWDLTSLDAGDGWLRQKYTEMGIIQFEDWIDTSEEYASLDAIDPAS
jgi:hypothetical protein